MYLLASQPIDQSCSVGHLASAVLGIILQVLLLLHGSIIKRLKYHIPLLTSTFTSNISLQEVIQMIFFIFTVKTTHVSGPMRGFATFSSFISL